MNTNGDDFLFQVDSPANYNLVPNSTYFLDRFLGVPLYKNSTGTVINPWTDTSGSASYTVYTALISQTGTDAPTAIVLENTTGATVTFTKSAPGVYQIVFSSAIIVEAKLFVMSQVNTVGSSYSLGFNDTSSVYMDTANAGTGVQQDGLLYNDSIEIRIYN